MIIHVYFSQGYNTIGPNASISPSGVSPATDGLGTSPLPPMSSLRGAPPSAPSPIAVTPSSMMYPGHNSPTIQTPGDTLGKALASVRYIYLFFNRFININYKCWDDHIIICLSYH